VRQICLNKAGANEKTGSEAAGFASIDDPPSRIMSEANNTIACVRASDLSEQSGHE
jgi:hypothetical protein